MWMVSDERFSFRSKVTKRSPEKLANRTNVEARPANVNVGDEYLARVSAYRKRENESACGCATLWLH